MNRGDVRCWEMQGLRAEPNGRPMTTAEGAGVRGARRHRIMAASTSSVGPIVLGLTSFLALLVEQRSGATFLIRVLATAGGATLAGVLYRQMVARHIGQDRYFAAVITVVVVWLAAEATVSLGMDEDSSPYILFVWSRFWLAGAIACAAWFIASDRASGETPGSTALIR